MKFKYTPNKASVFVSSSNNEGTVQSVYILIYYMVYSSPRDNKNINRKMLVLNLYPSISL